MSRTRAVVVFALGIISAVLVAACGGGGGNDEDPQQVLDQTFNNPTSIRSGTFDLDFRIETSGGDNPGSLEVKLGGRFQSRPSQLPEFDVDASLKGEGGSQSFSGTGGLTATADAAFVNYQGTDYVVPQQLYDEFTTTYAELQGQNKEGESSNLLKTLNISPANWLSDLKNDGTEDVEGTKTIHISGTANVSKLVEDLKAIAQKAGNAVGNLDTEQLNRLNDVVQSGDIDVFSGEEDKLLRRFQVGVDLKPPEGTPGAPDSLTIDFQLNLATVNQPQTIRPPANAQPLQTLFDKLGLNPGELGKSLRGGLGTGGALPESGGSTTAPSPSATQAYQQCLSQASGSAELQKCAELLSQ